MARRRVRLQLIANESDRKSCFKKRQKGFLEKVSELSTLCDVDACAIVYNLWNGEPELWPSSMGVHRVVEKFRGIPDMERSRKMMNQESYIRSRTKKAEDTLRKVQRENRRKEIQRMINQCLAGNWIPQYDLGDLCDIGERLDQNIKELTLRINALRVERADQNVENPPLPPALPPPPPTADFNPSVEGLMILASMADISTTNDHVSYPGTYVGESSNSNNNPRNHMSTTEQNTQNGVENFGWMNNMDMGTSMLGWDETPAPFVFDPMNNNAPGPSYP